MFVCLKTESRELYRALGVLYSSTASVCVCVNVNCAPYTYVSVSA